MDAVFAAVGAASLVLPRVGCCVAGLAPRGDLGIIVSFVCSVSTRRSPVPLVERVSHGAIIWRIRRSRERKYSKYWGVGSPAGRIGSARGVARAAGRHLGNPTFNPIGFALLCSRAAVHSDAYPSARNLMEANIEISEATRRSGSPWCVGPLGIASNRLRFI